MEEKNKSPLKLNYYSTVYTHQQKDHGEMFSLLF